MAFIESMNRFVWGVPALLGVLGVGVYLTIRTGFCQIRLLPKALKMFVAQICATRYSQQGTSPYRALCTALAATVGTGNLAGVAGAIAIGGPGAIFWMWICAVLGMVTKFAEATLAVGFRRKNSAGEWIGGPMYIMQGTFRRKWRWLAYVYSFFGVVAAFGIGNATQINAVIGSAERIVSAYHIPVFQGWHLLIGFVLAVIIGAVLLGGAKRIGELAEQIVPFAALLYIALSVILLMGRANYIPQAFVAILHGAFTPQAVAGGLVGSFFTALRTGAARGVVTNEAGMGTASIAHAGANVNHPVEQGLMGIMEVFIDTIVICTMTALVILCSGVNINYGVDTGIELTMQAFASFYGDWVSVPLTVAVTCFALATVFGWGLYGIRCAQFIFGDHVWRWFVWLQIGTVLVGAVLRTDTVWLLSELVNGLMAIPNLILLCTLVPTICTLLDDYCNKKQIDISTISGRIRK